MPNRIIKDSIFTSPNFNRLSVFGERHFYRVLMLADDYGCFESTPAVIKGFGYPLKTEEVSIEDIQAYNKELEQKGILLTWQNGDRQYSIFRTFDRHNARYTVTKDGKPSRHRRKTPIPPQDILDQLV